MALPSEENQQHQTVCGNPLNKTINDFQKAINNKPYSNSFLKGNYLAEKVSDHLRTESENSPNTSPLRTPRPRTLKDKFINIRTEASKLDVSRNEGYHRAVTQGSAEK